MADRPQRVARKNQDRSPAISERRITDLEIARAIEHADCIPDLAVAVSKIVRALGFERFLYGMQAEPIAGGRPQFLITNYPQSWMEKYRIRSIADNDPILAHVMRTSAPIWWDALQNMTCDEIAHREIAKSCGLVQGITVSANCRTGRHSLMSFSMPNQRVLGEQTKASLEVRCQWIALRLHEKAISLINQAKDKTDGLPRLTEKESACLRATASLLPLKGIAKSIGISERAVKFHLANATRKLNAPNRQAAVFRAVSLGLLHLTATVSASAEKWEIHIAPLA